MKVFIFIATIMFALVIYTACFNHAHAHGNQSHSGIGHGNNINNCNPSLKCEPKVVRETKWKTKVVEKVVEKRARKNTLSLLGMYSPTKLKVNSANNSVTSETTHEMSVGLLYQHNLHKNLVGGVGAALNGTFMLTLGVDF